MLGGVSYPKRSQIRIGYLQRNQSLLSYAAPPNQIPMQGVAEEVPIEGVGMGISGITTIIGEHLAELLILTRVIFQVCPRICLLKIPGSRHKLRPSCIMTCTRHTPSYRHRRSAYDYSYTTSLQATQTWAAEGRVPILPIVFPDQPNKPVKTTSIHWKRLFPKSSLT